jgi:hypothetical protein
LFVVLIPYIEPMFQSFGMSSINGLKKYLYQ